MAIKQATVVQIEGTTFAAKGNSRHWTVMDSAVDKDALLTAATPKELLLFALGGCTSSDVISILKKKRVPVQHYELTLRAEESPEHPKVFTEIQIEYVFYGSGIKPADIEHAIELSTTKYCSVSAMLKSSVRMEHSYRIEAPDKLLKK